MNIVEPIRDKDDIQAMKDYLKEWNERNYILFLVGINTGFRHECDILKKPHIHFEKVALITGVSRSLKESLKVTECKICFVQGA